MKTFLRQVVLPAAIVFVAVGAAYFLGWKQAHTDSTADLLVKAPVLNSPQTMSSRSPIAVAKAYLSTADAEKQLAEIEPGADSATRRAEIQARMHVLDQMRPDEAVEIVQNMPDSSIRDALLRDLLLSWVHTDTKAAMEWLSRLPPDEALKRARVIYINYLDAPGALVAAQYLDKLTDANNRDMAINRLSTEIASKDPQGALEWLGKVATGDNYTKSVAAIFNELSSPGEEPKMLNGDWTEGGSVNESQNLPLAISLLGNITDPAVRNTAIATIADGWGKTDSDAALKWAASLPDTDSTARAAALNTIVATWTNFDPGAAAAFVEKSNNPTLFLPDVPMLADALSKYDAQGALNFVQSLPDGATKDQAVNNVLVNLANTDFSTAWNFANNLPTGASRDAAMTSLVSAQAQMDPTQAVTLLDQFPAGPARQSATRAMTKTWAAQDPQAASVWMNTLPIGSQRNAAVIELITAQVSKDPAATFQWANTVSTAQTRANQIQRVVTSWAKTDPAAALNALQSANITDDQRAAFTQIINQAQAKAK